MRGPRSLRWAAGVNVCVRRFVRQADGMFVAGAGRAGGLRADDDAPLTLTEEVQRPTGTTERHWRANAQLQEVSPLGELKSQCVVARRSGLIGLLLLLLLLRALSSPQRAGSVCARDVAPPEMGGAREEPNRASYCLFQW